MIPFETYRLWEYSYSSSSSSTSSAHFRTYTFPSVFSLVPLGNQIISLMIHQFLFFYHIPFPSPLYVSYMLDYVDQVSLYPFLHLPLSFGLLISDSLSMRWSRQNETSTSNLVLHFRNSNVEGSQFRETIYFLHNHPLGVQVNV